MSRRIERGLKRLERIHRRRLLEQAERLRVCVTRDACERTDCLYFALPEDVAELVTFAADLLAEENRTEFPAETGSKCESAFASEEEDRNEEPGH